MSLEESFREIVGYIALGVESAAVVVAALGVIDALTRIAAAIAQGSTPHGIGKQIWRRLGMWLLLALEFALAADIIRSVISPSWADIGELAAIAVIRTFLNYFLEKDVAEAEGQDVEINSPRMAVQGTSE